MAVSAVTLVVAVGSDYHPFGDQALTELRVRDVGQYGVDVGLYSREGWNHPGPALFYVLAPVYWLAGSSSIALSLGALAVNAVAVAGMALVAWRRGGLPLLVATCLACSLLVHAFGADYIRDPWVPYVPVLPFGLLLFLVWDMTQGGRWAAPAAGAVASFLVQTHVGYAPLAIPLTALGIGWLVVTALRRYPGDDHDRQQRLRRLLAPLVLTGAIVALAWMPPILDELSNRPGNLAEIVAYFREGDGHGVGAGLRVVAAQFTVVPSWITGDRHRNPFTAETTLLTASPIPVLAFVLAAAALVARRRRYGDAVAMIAVVAASAVLGVASVARTIGKVYFYRLGWTWVIGAAAAAAAAWVLWRALAARQDRRGRVAARWVAGASMAAIAALAVTSSIGAARAGAPQEPWTSELEAIIDDVADSLPDRPGVVVISGDPIPALWYSWGLGLGLERQGVEVRYDRVGGRDVFGAHRVPQGEAVRQRLIVATGADFDAVTDGAGRRVIAYVGTVPLAERARLTAQRDALRDQHRAGAIDDRRYFARSSELHRRLGSAVVVVEDEDGR